MVHKIEETLTLNRPAYVGVSTLDLSKTLMYDFHYITTERKNIMIKLNVLICPDTDSLTYEIKTENAYKNFWSDKDKFDNSEYHENSPYSDKTNKK